jgi:hypothetical protein
MKKRYLYALLFGIPGLFVAGTISVLLFGAFAGILWLYVFGDDPWPPYTESLLSMGFVLTVSLLWMISIVLGYFVGQRLENDPVQNRNHILISAGLTVMFILFLLLQQFSVGNLGPKSDSVICSDFCAQHGYSGSGMPPETSGERLCSCYDDAGNEELRIPLDHLVPETPK